MTLLNTLKKAFDIKVCYLRYLEAAIVDSGALDEDEVRQPRTRCRAQYTAQPCTTYVDLEYTDKTRDSQEEIPTSIEKRLLLCSIFQQFTEPLAGGA